MELFIPFLMVSRLPPVQVIPKKTGITVIRSDKNELVPT